MTPSDAPIDVFISYKREERDVAKALAEVLARRGYSLWWDVELLLPGDRFADSIMAVINRAKAVVVLWSQQAVASDFVRAEARAAHAQGKLIPVRLDDCDLPLPFNDLHTLDLTTWWPDADDAKLEPLLRSLEVRIGKPRSPPQPPEATEATLHSQDHQADFWRSISHQLAPATVGEGVRALSPKVPERPLRRPCAPSAPGSATVETRQDGGQGNRPHEERPSSRWALWRLPGLP